MVMNENSPNVGRPYAACEHCSGDGKICFWFLDHGECDLCRCPLFRGPAKKGKHAGRMFEACSQGCPGKFRWLRKSSEVGLHQGSPTLDIDSTYVITLPRTR